jgi:hypothetical protein
MDLKDYRATKVRSLPKRRRKVGIIVGTVHFFASSIVVFAILGAAMKPIGDDADALWLIPFFVLLFPSCLLVFVGLLPLFGLLSIVIVPAQSALWGWAASRLLIRE